MSADTTAAIMASDQCVWRIESQVCDTCQDVCYSIEGWAEGTLGEGKWRTAIAYLTHVRQSTALATTARMIGRNADKVRNREVAAALIEIQQTLW